MGDVRCDRSTVVYVTVFFPVTISVDLRALERLRSPHDPHKGSLEPFCNTTFRWWRGSVVERRSLADELSLSCARPAADG